MAAVTEWVRTLVVLVVLASLLELLLPMGSMKRFVRLTMGLLILLGVARPVVGLLGGEVAFDPDLLRDSAAGLPSMNEIMAEAHRFQERSRALLAAEVEERLRRQAESAARAVDGVAEAQVALEMGGGPALESLRAERATVVVLLGSRFGQVRPVEPVRIGRADDVAGGGADRARTRLPLPAEAPLAEAVRLQVAEQLGIADPQNVTVLIEGRERSGR